MLRGGDHQHQCHRADVREGSEDERIGAARSIASREVSGTP